MGLRIEAPQSAINTLYETSPSRVLGCGSFGVVVLGLSKRTNRVCAIKSIRKSRCGSILNPTVEVELLALVNHQYVVRFIESIEDDLHLHIVMEVCAGRDLFDVVSEAAEGTAEYHFPLALAASILLCLFEAIRYLHSQDIVHCDIKTENIVIKTDGLFLQEFKLIDLGCAQLHGRGDAPLTRMAGTFEFMSPEVLLTSYDRRIDIWNAGIVAYVVVCGQRPFGRFQHPNQVERAILCGDYDTQSSAWGRLNAKAKELITELLETDANKRLSVCCAMEKLRE
jgi:calcium-dependent protein kinase